MSDENKVSNTQPVSDNQPPKGVELTEEDIQKLIMSPFEKRIDITKKIADYYKSGGFDPSQIQAAAEIFRALVRDAEVEVRKTLAEAIKDLKDVPMDVIINLANDVQEVSLPVLEFSEILSDIDLIEIVSSTQDSEKQKSIARRKQVSEQVTDALVDTRNAEVVESLLGNEGADVSENTFSQIVEEFKEVESVMGAMVDREKLPVSVIENLTEKISDTIQRKLAERNPEAFVRMEDTVKRSKEVAKMKVMGLRSTDAEYYQFTQLMEKLRIAEDLSPIYALCMGNINIFEVKIARITNTPVLNIRTLIFEGGNKGFKVLYERASLPPDLYEAATILMDVLKKLGRDLPHEGVYATKESAAKMVAEITKKVPDISAVKNLDFLVSLISHHAVAAKPVE